MDLREGDHYDISVKAGERVLLPHVRRADRKTLIVADGFSCREQIMQKTDRRALHTAQVIDMAYEHGRNGPGGELPENSYTAQPARIRPATVALFGLAAVGTFLLLRYLADQPLRPMVGHTWSPIPDYPSVMAFQG